MLKFVQYIVICCVDFNKTGNLQVWCVLGWSEGCWEACLSCESVL